MKLCLLKKDISSIIKSDSNKVILFEGFMDFLTWREISGPTVGPSPKETSFIILNSVNQIDNAKRKLLALPGIFIESYFDNDVAGRKCFESLKKDFPQAQDRSNIYEGFKDLNDMVMKSNVLSKTNFKRRDELSM